jgi:hypothetical protein
MLQRHLKSRTLYVIALLQKLNCSGSVVLEVMPDCVAMFSKTSVFCCCYKWLMNRLVSLVR